MAEERQSDFTCVTVRMLRSDRDAIEQAARADRRTVSSWVRCIVLDAVQQAQAQQQPERVS